MLNRMSLMAPMAALVSWQCTDFGILFDEMDKLPVNGNFALSSCGSFSRKRSNWNQNYNNSCAVCMYCVSVTYTQCFVKLACKSHDENGENNENYSKNIHFCDKKSVRTKLNSFSVYTIKIVFLVILNHLYCDIEPFWWPVIHGKISKKLRQWPYSCHC